MGTGTGVMRAQVTAITDLLWLFPLQIVDSANTPAHLFDLFNALSPDDHLGITPVADAIVHSWTPLQRSVAFQCTISAHEHADDADQARSSGPGARAGPSSLPSFGGTPAPFSSSGTARTLNSACTQRSNGARSGTPCGSPPTPTPTPHLRPVSLLGP